MTYVYESWMVLLHSTSTTDESESLHVDFFHTVIVHYSGHDCLFTFFEARMNFTFLSLCSICLLAAKCHFIPIPVTHLLSYFKPLKGTTSDDVTSHGNRKCANISICGLPIVFVSIHVAKYSFASNLSFSGCNHSEQKRVGLWCKRCLCHLCWPSSRRHIQRMQVTKWRLWLCFRGFSGVDLEQN